MFFLFVCLLWCCAFTLPSGLNQRLLKSTRFTPGLVSPDIIQYSRYILSLVFVTLYLCQLHCGNPSVGSNSQFFFSPWVLQAQWGAYAGQGESKNNDKHNDKLLCVVNIITTSATNDLLHAIFYTKWALKNRREESTINKIIINKKGKQGKKLILTRCTGDKFWCRQKSTFEVPCCRLRVH